MPSFPSSRFPRQLTSLGRGWRLADLVHSHLVFPVFQEPPQVSLDQEFEAFEEGYYQ